jgi:phage gpG-like protein
MAKLSDLDKMLQAKIRKAILKLPLVLANEAVNWSKQNFTRQGFPGESFQSWPARKPGSRKNAGRAILVNTGRLKRGVQVISSSGLQAKFGVLDVPYAAAHNNGFKGTVNVKSYKRAKIATISQGFALKKSVVGIGVVGSHQRHMNLPRRRFIGYSPVLQSILARKATITLARDLKS